jgi:two-component system sensor histidine kinase CpxA
VSIFSKLFLSFWVALTLCILATVLLYPPSYHNMAQHQRFLVRALQISAGQLADRYEDCGRQKAEASLARIQQENGVTLALYDDNATPLAGGSGGTLQTHAENLTPDPVTLRYRQPVTLTLQTHSRRGTPYRVVAVLPVNFMESSPTLWLLSYRLLVLGLISGLVCYALAKYLTAPLVVLRDVTHRLASGDLKARANSARSTGGDEIASLVRDFNRMAEHLDSLMTAQKRLVGDVSHELRSPLARLNVALGLARTKQGPELAHALDRIENEAERLNEMVAQILRVSELEVTLDTPRFQVIDLTALTAAIAEDGNYEARQEKRTVRFSAGEPCWVRGDKELLHRAIDNVVRNALRYTPEESAVEVTLERREAMAVLRIRDHGQGIPPQELDNIFQPFYRLSYDRDRQTGGSGLGLAISDRAIRLHGGHVQASNAGDGGLVVELQIPCLQTEVE